MKRFHRLLKDKVAEDNEKKLTYRQLGKIAGVAPMSVSDYVLLGTEPRLKALEKFATYFEEPVAALLLEDTEENKCEVEIYKALAKMTAEQKQQLLETIRTCYISATYSDNQPKPKQKGSASKTCEAL